MRKTLLAGLAVSGALAAGCTHAPADEPGTAAPVTTVNIGPPTTAPTVADLRVGQAAWVLSTAAYADDPSGCINLDTTETAKVTSSIPADVADTGWSNGLLVERPNATSLVVSWKIRPGHMTRKYRLTVYNAATDLSEWPPSWQTAQCKQAGVVR